MIRALRFHLLFLVSFLILGAASGADIADYFARTMKMPRLDPHKRARVLYQRIAIITKEDVGPLLKGLRRDDPNVKALCALSLGLYGRDPEEYIGGLVGKLTDGATLPRASKDALNLVVCLECGIPRGDVQKLLNHELNIDVNKLLKFVKLRMKRKKKPIEYVFRDVYKGSKFPPAMRVGDYAAFSLSLLEIAKVDVISLLTALLGNSDNAVAGQAAALLAEYGDRAKGALPRLEQMMKSEDMLLKINVAYALSRIVSENAATKDLLIDLEKESDAKGKAIFAELKPKPDGFPLDRRRFHEPLPFAYTWAPGSYSDYEIHIRLMRNCYEAYRVIK